MIGHSLIQIRLFHNPELNNYFCLYIESKSICSLKKGLLFRWLKHSKMRMSFIAGIGFFIFEPAKIMIFPKQLNRIFQLHSRVRNPTSYSHVFQFNQIQVIAKYEHTVACTLLVICAVLNRSDTIFDRSERDRRLIVVDHRCDLSGLIFRITIRLISQLIVTYPKNFVGSGSFPAGRMQKISAHNSCSISSNASNRWLPSARLSFR